jgi:hypothetical protein
VRSIISTFEFDQQVEALGGAKAIDDALSPLIEALMQDPYGFTRFENDFTSFRYAMTLANALTPPLAIVFTIDENKNVVLERVEVLP